MVGRREDVGCIRDDGLCDGFDDDNGPSAKDTTNDEQTKRRLLHTAVFFFAFFVFGWVVGQRGAAFLDLILITNTDVTLGSLLFTMAGLASIAGAIAGGFLMDTFKRPRLIVAISMLLNAALNGTIPLCSSLPVMMTLYFLSHFGLSSVDAVVNAQMAKLWKGGGGPYMQGLHGCFAVGAILSPLTTQPFLAPRADQHHLGKELKTDSTKEWNNSLEAMLCNPSVQESDSSGEDCQFVVNFTGEWRLCENTSDDTLMFAKFANISASADLYNLSHDSGLNQTLLELCPEITITESNVFYAFLMSAILCLLSGIFVSLLRLVPVKTIRKKDEESEQTPPAQEVRNLLIIAVVLVGIFYFFGSSVEDVFPHYLMTFVVRELDWSKTSGAHVTSVYWVGLAVGRLSGVWLVRVLSSARILAGCLLALLLSLTGLLLAAIYHQHWAVWTCAAATGLSVSMLFATGLSYTHERVMPLTGRLAALILTTPMIAAMLNPLLLSHLMTHYDDLCYVYVFLVQTVLAAGSFGVLHGLTVKLRKARESTLVLSVIRCAEDGEPCLQNETERM